jgi:hypothetical protein
MKKYITKNQRIADLQEQVSILTHDIYVLIDNKDKKLVDEIFISYVSRRLFIEGIKAHIMFLAAKRPTDWTVGVKWNNKFKPVSANQPTEVISGKKKQGNKSPSDLTRGTRKKNLKP